MSMSCEEGNAIQYTYLLSVVIHHVRSKHHHNGGEKKCSEMAGRVFEISTTVDTGEKTKQNLRLKGFTTTDDALLTPKARNLHDFCYRYFEVCVSKVHRNAEATNGTIL